MAKNEPITDREIIDWLCSIEEGLTDWEVNFIESITRQFESKGCLSDPQRKVAKRICWERG